MKSLDFLIRATAGIICVFIGGLLIGAVGDSFRTVETDASGNMTAPTSLSTSNFFRQIPAATGANDVVTVKDLTNASSTIFVVPVARGGTGTNTTMLVGNYTNTGHFVASSNLTVASNLTINGNATFSGQIFKGTDAGWSGVLTNNGVGATNYLYYGGGLVTNAVTVGAP